MGQIATSLKQSSDAKADEEYAARIVNMLLASYPQGRPRDADTYIRQLVAVCADQPKDVLRDMVHPKIGVLANLNFLPTVAEVNRWIEKQKPKPGLAFKKFAPIEDKPEDPPEVKDAAIARWQRAKSEMGLRQVTRKSTLTWKQTHDPDALLRALKD